MTSPDLPRGAVRRAVPGAQHRRRAPARKPAAGRGGAGRAAPTSCSATRRRPSATRTALTFLRTADPADEPMRWSYAELLAGIHQTANLLHALGVGPDDAVGVLLPGCLEYHLALWGGEAAASCSRSTRCSPTRSWSRCCAPRARKALDRLGLGRRVRHLVEGAAAHGQAADADDACCASRRTARRRKSRAEPPLPEGVADFGALRSRQPDDRLASGRDIAAVRHRRLLPHRRHHRRAQAGPPQPRRAGLQRLGLRACCTALTAGDVAINGYPLFHVAGVLSTSLAALSPASRRSSRPPRCCATARCCATTGGWSRSTARRRCRRCRPCWPRWPTCRSTAPTSRRSRYCRTGAVAAAARAGGALRAHVRPACAREPRHDRDGRHLDRHAAGRARPGRLRRFPAAVLAAAHRRARRARRRERARAAARRGRAWCCSARRTCSRASSTRPTTRRPSPPTAGSPPATSAGSTTRSGCT